MGLLVTFEGIEGSGKSTQIELVKEFLQREGYPCIVTKEPGGSPLGEEIRKLLLEQGGIRIDPLAELFLFEADRTQHVTELLKPAVDEGKVVLCDRFVDATIVYQGYGRGVDIGLIEDVNHLATDGLAPDLTILLDCPVEVGMTRAQGKDRFEREEYAFHQRVREGYLRIAHQEPQRVKVISAEGEIEMVQEEIQKIIRPLLGRRRE